MDAIKVGERAEGQLMNNTLRRLTKFLAAGAAVLIGQWTAGLPEALGQCST